MKSELLDNFFLNIKGVENCIAILKSEDARFVASSFVRLVRSAQTQEEDILSEINLSKSPEYQALLLRAFETKKYDEVEQYILNALSLQPNPEVSRKREVAQVEGEATLATAFEGEYARGAEATFCEYLERCNRAFRTSPQSHYAKFCSIVQSSGTGKSRMLIELKEQGVIVVYMNIRGMKEDNAYPTRDNIPASILTKNLQCSEEVYASRCVAFFTALFITLKLWLEKFVELHSSREGVVNAWSSDMCRMGSQTRTEFFKELQGHYDKAFERIQLQQSKRSKRSKQSEESKQQKALEATMATMSIEETGSTGKEPLAPKLKSASTSGSSSQETQEQSTAGPSGKDNETKAPGPKTDRASDGKPGDGRQNQELPGPQLPGGTAMTRAYQELLSMSSLFDDQGNAPQLVIAIDEAHLLRQLQDTYLPSHILCRAISVFSKSQKEVSNWVVFASTTSKVADFSAPAHIHASLRIHEGGPRLFPPYSLLDWDQKAPALPDIDLENVAQFRHLVKFGRPLWDSLIDSGVAPQVVLATAHSKLCHSQSFDKYNRSQMLAMLGQRFILDVCFGSYYSSEFQQTAVSSHLRVCLGTTEDRTWQETTYPSEPLLSCVAAQIMYQQPTPPWGELVLKVALDHLQDAIVSRLISQGPQGQPGGLVSRLVYLIGKDLAIRRHTVPPVQNPSSELLDCKPLAVTEYLDVMFGLDKLGDTKIFEGWYINFSHWIPMSETIKFVGDKNKRVSDMQTWLARHWARTSAVQCYHYQSSFDQVIPMYKLSDPSKQRPDENQHAGRMSFILVQDKAREQAASMDEVNGINPKKANLPILGQPYIAILADLRVGEAGVEAWTRNLGGTTALCIHASGLGPGAYRFLGDPRMASAGKVLKTIVDLPQLVHGPTLSEQKIGGRLRFGSATRDENMAWR